MTLTNKTQVIEKIKTLVDEEFDIDKWLSSPNVGLSNQTPNHVIENKGFVELETMFYLIESGQPC